VIGAHSVWWKWIAPAAGQLSLDTHGSNFDTLLAVYSGVSVSALTSISANDNDGSAGNASGLLFQTKAGQEYEIAVDGVNVAQGAAVLNLSLNTTATSNLSVNLTGPGSITLGVTSDYSLTVNNAGPQAATNVVVSLPLPAGASYVSGTSGCSAVGNNVSCQLDSLPNTGSQVFTIQILWSSITGSPVLTATTTSDVPDTLTTNNSASISMVLSSASSTNNSADNDVPTLPEWGLLVLATGMLLVVGRARKEFV
jgi:uncharacterized repeat protein (TIGR01451 family)